MANVKGNLPAINFSEFEASSDLLPLSIDYIPSQSYIVSFGIDEQTVPDDFQNLLGPIRNDANNIAEVFTTFGKILPQNAHVYCASEKFQFCTDYGMEYAFKTTARQVGPDGLFVFYFSGHGSNRQGESLLVTTCSHFVTADDLVRWCHEVNCKAKHTLFIFDCCLSGGVANKLVKLSVEGSLYIMTACRESQLVSNIQELENSIFTFFLVYSFKKHCGPPPSPMLPLRAIFDESQLCSRALSDLIIRMNSDKLLEIMNMQPQSRVAQPPFMLKGEPGSSTESLQSRRLSFAYAYELYRLPPHKSPTLHDSTKAILEIWFMEQDGGAIHELNTRGLLKASEKVLTAALCSMMYSIGTVEGAIDRVKVEEVDLSIVAFLAIAIRLNNIIPGLNIPKSIFHIAWKKYKVALQNISVRSEGFSELEERLKNDIELSEQQ